ncbi:MAG: DUF1573 domain-containing protein [Verrucomicrobiae bacterium]|nr:DUF1573 domain-containing protein [Verrucomicrobiae bacterium]
MMWLRAMRGVRLGCAALAFWAASCACVQAKVIWDATERVLGMGRGVGEVEVAFGFLVEGSDAVIWKVETDCACAKASVERESFAVGERGEVRVKVRFPGSAGRHRKQVIVWTNDIPNVRQVLTVVGLIEGPRMLRPAILTWGLGEAPAGKWLQAVVSEGRGVGGAAAHVGSDLFEVRGGMDPSDGAPRWEVVPRDTSRAGRSVISVDLPREGPGPPWTLVAVAEVK